MNKSKKFISDILELKNNTDIEKVLVTVDMRKRQKTFGKDFYKMNSNFFN